MPIYEFGYRPWHGRRRPWWLRWFPITRAGVGLAFQNRMLRRLMFIAWMPLLYYGLVFFVLGKVTEPGTLGPPPSSPLRPTIRLVPPPPVRPTDADSFEAIGSRMLGLPLGEKRRDDPRALRASIWSWSFYHYMRLPQLLALFLVVTIVGPPLIAHDVRAKSFLLYFSKPITRWDYLAGKAGVLLSFSALVTLAPALVLYAISIGFSPSLGAILDTWSTVIKVFAAFAVTSVPAALLVLFYSSLSREPRFATFAWVATCIVGELFYWVLLAAESWRNSRWIFLVSPRQIAQVAIGAIFDVSEQFQALSGQALPGQATPGMPFSGRPPALPVGGAYSETAAFVALLLVSAVCLVGVLRRITAPLRV
jgi:hypothetical protein